MTRESIGAGFAAAVAADPTRPLLTWYDDATGDRTELSGATLANWVAKTGNLLVDGCGLGPGDSAAMLLPPHWQTAAVLLGAWSAGLAPTGPESPRGVDVLFVSADRIDQAADWPAGDRYALALAPLAAPLRAVPAGYVDYVVEVRGFGDRFEAYSPIGPDDPAWAGATAVTHGELRQQALARASALGVGSGDRVLIDAAAHPDPVDWLLAPLLAGASIVLCGNLDAARLPGRIDAERVTVPLAG